jgi:hypothetical protein
MGEPHSQLLAHEARPQPCEAPVIWIVMVLVVALIVSLGCNLKQEFELKVLRVDNDELIDELAMLQARTETRSTARQSVHLNDIPTLTNAQMEAWVNKWAVEP